MSQRTRRSKPPPERQPEARESDESALFRHMLKTGFDLDAVRLYRGELGRGRWFCEKCKLWHKDEEEPTS